MFWLYVILLTFGVAIVSQFSSISKSILQRLDQSNHLLQEIRDSAQNTERDLHRMRQFNIPKLARRDTTN